MTRCGASSPGSAASAPSRASLLEIEGDRIAAVGAGRGGAPADAERLPGLTLPGLANAHSHAFQRALRGRTQAGTGSFWTWREQMYELAGTLDPDSCLALARATFAEMALAGITLVGEFHYLHHAPGGTPYDDPNAMGRAVIAAAAEAGIRITLLDACYLRGGLERFRDADARRLGRARGRARASGRPLRVGAAIHSVRAVDPESARAVAAWARAGGRCTRTSPSSRPRTRRASPRTAARRPPLLADAGALSRALHRRARDAPDRRRRRAARRRRRDRLPVPDDRARPRRRHRPGAAAARGRARRSRTGSDSQAVIDLFEEARAIELDERLATGVRGLHRAAALLRAATAGGYAALGWPDGGRIEAGRARRPRDASRSTACASPAPARRTPCRRVVFAAARRATSATSWSAAAGSSATART